MKPLVSICIPNYNGEKFLEESLKSAISQTYPNIEIIVLDNASTDKSCDIVKSFGNKVKLYRHRTNVGYNDNLNSCIRIAEGKYIKILHSDDMLEINAVEIQVIAMEKSDNIGISYGSVNFIDESGKPVEKTSFSVDVEGITSGMKKLEELLKGNHIMFPSVMIRKKCFDNIGLFDGEIPYCNDWDMWMRICMHYDIAFIHEAIARYRIHTESGTKKYEETHIDGFDQYKCLTKIFTMISDEILLNRKSGFFRRLAGEQISRGLYFVSNGNKAHGRRCILTSAIISNNPAFTVIVYVIYMSTFFGKRFSGILLQLGRLMTK